MKVLYVVTDDWYFLSHRLPLARAARDAGHEVVVATRPSGREAEIEAEGLGLRPVAFRRSVGGQAANVGALRALERLYRDERPDVVHHVAFLPIFWGTLAARRAGVPAVVNAVTGLGDAFVEGGARRRALRRALEAAYRRALRGPGVAALFQNDEDRALFAERGVLRCEALVVPGSGVDVARFLPTPEPDGGAPLVLHPSRMLRSKGVETTLEASRRLRARGVAHRLALAGRTHATNPAAIPAHALRRYERDYHCTWLGHRRDLPLWMARAAVVCLPTWYREGVPMALLEAAASGRPIVTTDAPGCRDAVRHGETGLLVPPRDPDALADALEALLADRDLRARYGAAGRRLAERRFATDHVCRATLALYDRLLLHAAAA